ncbi:C1 family peptidase [Sinorhizobium sp. RAC02]|uniref:C1 family peptidase n=1 Tax=Sinorhizobium sp. RAC02 TaxID=1842534 RepID=UPI0008576602|nr:C1 family peptidase [Sinorhizobium sp. RAC02]AOF91744.1 papain cysteine protease family protein [Sinorhizobium sp. RAC02]
MARGGPRKGIPSGKGPTSGKSGGVHIGGRFYLTSLASATAGGRVLDILPDLPDIRDRAYQPHLQRLAPQKTPRIAFSVRNQGQTQSCVGHSLAHIIDVLRFAEPDGPEPERVSAQMLYEMARKNDEWAETIHDGSSLRGGLKGFFRNGVCTEGTPGEDAAPWVLTYDIAKAARATRLGAYFRVQPDISDYHAALQEVGAVYISAQIHSNWDKPKNGRIAPGGTPKGGHAFVIVGYDAEGFWILNSWGEEWGKDGTAHWSYEDWAATVMDAWVLQLGVPAPNAFSAVPKVTAAEATGLFGFGDPKRDDILGHFINIDDGRLITQGKYYSPSSTEMLETVDRLTRTDSNGGKGFSDLVIYAHGGLNTTVAESKRISAWKRSEIFTRNRIYNFHLMWASGFFDEVFGSMSNKLAGLAGGGLWDPVFETGLGKDAGQKAWRNMKGDAEAAFFDRGTNSTLSDEEEYGGGIKGLRPLLKALDTAENRPRLHLVGHSAGSIVLGRLLSAFDKFGLKNTEIASVHLMAPACTVKFFEDHYQPLLSGKGKATLSGKIHLYMMTDKLEQDDIVGLDTVLLPAYSRSLLYLVSRAYEEKPGTPLAGMEIFQPDIPKSSKMTVDLSSGASGAKTQSTSHGGFDNDAATLATIMERILGAKPKKPPIPSEMEGY